MLQHFIEAISVFYKLPSLSPTSQLPRPEYVLRKQFSAIPNVLSYRGIFLIFLPFSGWDMWHHVGLQPWSSSSWLRQTWDRSSVLGFLFLWLNTIPKCQLERKGVIYFQIIVHHLKKSGQELRQGRNLEARADMDGGHGGVLLGDLRTVACSACFLMNPGSPNQRWPHPQWAGPALTNH